MRKYLPWLIIILFAADRLLKFLALKIPGFFLIPKIFSFEFYKNYEIAFGLPITIDKWIWWLLMVFVLAVLIVWLIQSIVKKRVKEVLALGLIFSGAVSNTLDRLILGYTIDYFNFLSFSMFNLADVMILAGIGLLIYFSYQKSAGAKIKN